MKNIIDGKEYEIKSNAPVPPVYGVEESITNIIEENGTIVADIYNYITGRYSKKEYPPGTTVEDLLGMQPNYFECMMEETVRMPRVQNGRKITEKITKKSYGNLWVFEVLLEEAGIAKPKHRHEFDHLHLIVKGKAELIIFDDNDKEVHSEVFTAPQWVKIPKMQVHTFVALEDDTVGYCIHPMRDGDDDLVASDYGSDVLESYSYLAVDDILEASKK